MKHSLLLLFFSLSMFAQKSVESFDSKKLGEKRQITIGLPASYENNTSKRYPILILFDGEYLFDPFYGALNYGAYWDDLPETIIIGISQNRNNEREEDCAFDPTEGLPTRRASQFFEFIGGELMPYIEQKYRVAPFRIIAGHDTTAGFLNFYLLKENPLFNAYISLSPELAPGINDQITSSLTNTKKQLFYYQSSADGDIRQLREPVEQLDKSLKAITNPLVDYKYSSFSNASHYSLVLYSIPEALYQIFGSYKPISSTEFTEKIVVLKSGYVDYLTTKYTLIENKLGLKIPVRINDFKAIEAAILKNKAYDELDKLADLANKNYPKSMLASYELGLMYEKQGDAKKAAAKYQRASQLEEIGDLTKEMMYNKYDDMKGQTIKK
ncbi:alpha/beta hydrolase-fold protein [Flavobacterium sp.]|uniref:alpha/beta hydrolase n=1 Tax=Flavobacterium sp. TaxID=239 RepID=UPI00262D67D1|nr:alpha/beta hydrolase-fold protein [Flavobacterium sp.]MDG2430885.1 alpha/beta hydrolase-fold protein [Flavobacterium sp.]